MSESLTIQSFAKINLFLDVICKRPDGYHNIETVFQTIDLHDDLTLELLPSGLEVRSNDPSVPCDSRNLAARAYLAFQKLVHYRGGIRISLEKRIPVGAGLGGGSSNAAAVLLGCASLFSADVPPEDLHDIAQQLGADVPFFLTGGLAAAWGKGEKLMPLASLPASPLVMAVPKGVSVSTALAYSKIDAAKCSSPPPETLADCSNRLGKFINTLNPSIMLASNTSLLALLYNKFEGAIFPLHPEISRLKQGMTESGAQAALMTGSGSAVFGIAKSCADAKLIARNLESLFPCRCFVTQTIGHGSRLCLG